MHPSTPENSVTASSRDTLAESSFSTDICTTLQPDLTKAGLDAHYKQIYFSQPLDNFIHQLTTVDPFIIHSSSVCFPHGLFLWFVWPY